MQALIRTHQGVTPKIDEQVFLAETAVIIGDVEIEEHSGIWYGCVLRGDGNHIRVGKRTNIQDGTIVHIQSNDLPCLIGSDVTIGHQCLIHACTLEDYSFVGMGATVLDGAVVESRAMVAAGSMVTPGKVVKAGELWAGSPAKYMRDLTDKDYEMFDRTASHYWELAQSFMSGD